MWFHSSPGWRDSTEVLERWRNNTGDVLTVRVRGCARSVREPGASDSRRESNVLPATPMEAANAKTVEASADSIKPANLRPTPQLQLRIDDWRLDYGSFAPLASGCFHSITARWPRSFAVSAAVSMSCTATLLSIAIIAAKPAAWPMIM